jgi:hypothetical protein
MGLRLTATEGKCALYDSVTDWAFGPVFDSPGEAEAFLRWTEAQGIEGGDVRSLSMRELEALSDRYFRETSDGAE